VTNVLCKSDAVADLLSYLETVVGCSDYPSDDSQLNAIASYLLSDTDVDGLIRRYRKGHVNHLELTIAELLLDECVRLTLKDLVNHVYQNLKHQLGDVPFKDLKTTRGLIIVKLRSLP